MNYETLNVELQDGLMTITLNRPEVLNAMNPQMLADLTDVTTKAKEDDSIRAVLMTGSGRAFCAGADLGQVNTDQDREKREDQGNRSEDAMIRFFNPTVENIVTMNKPVIAAVNGVTAGGGMGLALAADLIFAAESAYFVQVFVPQLGIVPDTGSTWTLPRAVGRARALGMMLTGEKISAKQAEEWGMIWKCVADEQLQEVAFGAAKKLAKMPTYGIGLTKEAVRNSSHNSVAEQLSEEARLNKLGCSSSDFAVGAKAFMEKQPPIFSGLQHGHEEKNMN